MERNEDDDKGEDEEGWKSVCSLCAVSGCERRVLLIARECFWESIWSCVSVRCVLDVCVYVTSLFVQIVMQIYVPHRRPGKFALDPTPLARCGFVGAHKNTHNAGTYLDICTTHIFT